MEPQGHMSVGEEAEDRNQRGGCVARLDPTLLACLQTKRGGHEPRRRGHEPRGAGRCKGSLCIVRREEERT